MGKNIVTWGGNAPTAQPQSGGPELTLLVAFTLSTYRHVWPYQDFIFPPASLSGLPGFADFLVTYTRTKNHSQRMTENIIPRIIVDCQLKGMRRCGRPRKR
jgi:hypothetical protein